MRTWKIVLFAVVLVFAVGTIVYALNTSTAADSNCQVFKCNVSGQEIQLSSDGCCPKESEKDCPKEAEKGCPKEASGCDKE